MSARDISRELGLSPGRPTDVNAVLYGNPDKFSSHGTTPPLWQLISSHAPADFDDLLDQIQQIAAKARNATDSTQPWDIDFDSEYEFEPCPQQVAPRPSYGTAKFQMHWPRLNAGTIEDINWPEFAKRLAVTVDDYDFDEVVINISDELADIAYNQPPLAIHIERILDVIPYWVAWFIDFDEEVLRAAHSCYWHIWSLADPAAWDDVDALVDPNEVDGVEDHLVSWRSPTPLDLVRAIGVLLYDHCGIPTPTGLELQVERPSAEQARQREQEAREREHHRERLGHVWKGFKNPVAGACSICSRPLRDPLSLRRGIGPDCFQRYGHLGLPIAQMRADVPVRFWVGCQPVDEWRRRFLF